MKKDITANENEAISALVQLHLFYEFPGSPRFCSIESLVTGENERIVRLHVRKFRTDFKAYEVHLCQETLGSWQVWKITYSAYEKTGSTEVRTKRGWVAARKDTRLGTYRFAEAPPDLHIDSNHDYYFGATQRVPSLS